MYAGGHFGPAFAGRTRHQLVALRARNGNVLDYSVRFTGRNHPGIWEVVADPDALFLGGGFRLANVPTARYARFPTL